MTKYKLITTLLIITIIISVLLIIMCGYFIKKRDQINPYNPNNSNVSLDDNSSSDIDADILIVMKDPDIYSYTDMEKDINTLCNTYPDIVSCNSIAETIDGRNVYDIVIGKTSASKQIMIQGSIHAREYITTQLVMKQLVTFLSALSSNEVVYQGKTANELLSDYAIHVIPMVNPDGVSISQNGLAGIQNESTLETVKNIATYDGKSINDSEYLTQWKSNAQGVDLNRNFDADWERYEGPSHPSSDHYKGTSVGCTPESSALIRLTEQYPFVRTISYHSQGQVIYWYFEQTGELYNDTERFAQNISEETGYRLDKNYAALDPAGYKDWAIIKKGIPSITVEVGIKTNPVPPSQFDTIWKQNKNVWYKTLMELHN